MAEKPEKNDAQPKQASEKNCLAVVCKTCGELKRRKHRSDALGWHRAHLNEHPKHEVEIIERKLEAAKPKGKSAKPAKSAKKSKPAKPAAKAQAASAA
jgi:hypothetical protein